MTEPNIKKHILSWRRILIEHFGSPVKYIPNEVPVDYNSKLLSWEGYRYRTKEWFSYKNFMIGLDHVTSPTHLTILVRLNGLLYHQSIFTARSSELRFGTHRVNFHELKTFFNAMKDKTKLPLCINYAWATDLMKGALSTDEKF